MGLVASELAEGQAAVTEGGKTHSSDLVKAQKLACQLISHFLYPFIFVYVCMYFIVYIYVCIVVYVYVYILCAVLEVMSDFL